MSQTRLFAIISVVLGVAAIALSTLSGDPVGPGGDATRGMSPYAEWIWTINGAGHNVLEVTPGRWGSPASKLAEIIRSGHPDQDGKQQVDVADRHGGHARDHPVARDPRWANAAHHRLEPGVPAAG